MKIYRGDIGIELSVEEFIKILEEEEGIEEIAVLIDELEEGLSLDEDEVGFFDAIGNVATLAPPTPTNQFFINVNVNKEPEALDMDYLKELEDLESDELKKVRRILERFSSFLK